MKIEIWSDFACPFCYIGKRMLEKALEEFEDRDKINVVYRCFQLNPNGQKISGVSYAELIAKKYSMPLDEAKFTVEQMTQYAASVGLVFNLDSIIHANTMNAHRLTLYARRVDKEQKTAERLLKAYFTESLDISEPEVLVTLAEEVGLDKEKVREIFTSNFYTSEVLSDLKESAALGIHSVPYFVFDKKFTLSGAKPAREFLAVLSKLKNS